MNAETMYKDGTYLSNNPTWHSEHSPWKAKQVRKMLEGNRISPTSFCEIGCGAGEILNYLANDYGSDVSFYGYEISPQAYEICREKEARNIHFFLRDLLDEKDASYDVVAAIDVFEHVEDCFGFLRKLRAKGEYKIFHIPLELSALNALLGSPFLDARASAGHIHYFTKQTAIAILKDTGYEILDYFYTKGSLEVPSSNWKASALKLPRKLLFSINQDWTARSLGGFSLMVLAK